MAEKTAAKPAKPPTPRRTKPMAIKERTYVPQKAIEAIAKDKVTDAGDGYVVATIDDHPSLPRQDGSPAQVGDVLSCQPDGTWQARPAGSRGAYEIARVSGPWLVYRPVAGGRVYLQPYVTEWPTV